MDDDLLEEALFSRDEEGRLLRLDEAQAKQLEQTYSLVVDGTPLTVARAQIAKDAQGNPLSKPDGSPKLRYTTILDAIRHATEYGRVVCDSVATALGLSTSPTPQELLGVACRSGNEHVFYEALLQLCRSKPQDAVEVLHGIVDKKLLGHRDEDKIAAALKQSPQDLVQAMTLAVDQRILFAPTKVAVERVPVLCHQDHLTPIAVCRVCAVQIANPARGRVERKLLPACQHWVQDGMVIYTMWAAASDEWHGSSETTKAAADKHRVTVRKSVQMLSELLSSQHLDPQRDAEKGRQKKFRNELDDLWNTIAASWERFPQDAKSPGDEADRQRALAKQTRFERHRGSKDPLAGPIKPLPIPPDSPFSVDYDSCILCDRCSRSCDEVRHFNVIGRSGKGASTHIAFDLNGRAMYNSSCHSCGECMKACPTGAITFERTVLDVGSKRWTKEFPAPQYEVVEPSALLQHDLFRRMSVAFLEWNRGAVRRRRVKPGDVVARQYEFGNVAFVLESGDYLICRKETPQPFTRLPERLKNLQSDVARYEKQHGNAVGVLQFERNMIVGEMSPMTHDRRNASIIALNAASLLEIDRNVLSEMLRVPDVREVVEDRYAERALRDFISDDNIRSSLFSDLTREENTRLIDTVAKTAKLVLVAPGEVVCLEKEPATDFFFIYQGYIKISSRAGILAHRGPSNYIGEIAMVLRDWPEAKELFPGNIGVQGLRTATCTALDTVELFRFPGDAIREFLNRPENSGIRDKLRQRCAELLTPGIKK